MHLKKRIIGFLLLAAIILISIPLFFGHSVSTSELKLSAKIPTPPAKPQDLSIPIPAQTTSNKPPVLFEDTNPPKTAVTTAAPIPNNAVPHPTDNLKQLPLPPKAAPNPPAPLVTTPSAETKTNTVEPKEESEDVESKPEKSTPEANSKPAPPQTAKHSTPSSKENWVIQLGSFANKKNIDQLMQTLKSKGFTPHSRVIQTSHGSLTSIWVGPYSQREEAVKLQTKLQAELKVQTFLSKEGNNKP